MVIFRKNLAGAYDGPMWCWGVFPTMPLETPVRVAAAAVTWGPAERELGNGPLWYPGRSTPVHHSLCSEGISESPGPSGPVRDRRGDVQAQRDQGAGPGGDVVARQVAQGAPTGAAVGATVEFKVHFRNGGKGRRRLRQGRTPMPKPVEPGRIPRISRLLALAIHFDKLIR